MRAGAGTLAALAALAAVGRLAFAWAPNVSVVYFVVFASGVAFGARAGAAVGALSMLASNLVLTGFHLVLFVNTPAVALLGFAGGLLGRVVDFGQRGEVSRAPALASLVGAVSVVAFSVVSDGLSYALFLLPSGAPPSSLAVLVVAGLAFNAVPALANAALFALALRPTLRGARLAGLLPEPRAAVRRASPAPSPP